MSLFTDLVHNVLGGNSASTENQTQRLLQGALQLLDQAGGVQGLAEKFQQSGLGDVVSSWIGTGRNKPVTSDEITNVLGKEQVAALSQEAGIPEEQGANVLAQVLPNLMDKLTPDGLMPDKSQLMTIGKVILGGAGIAAAAAAAAKIFGKEEEEAAPADFSDVTAGSSVAAHWPSGAGSSGSYTVVSGDTLSKIAKQHYGDANAWPRIFEANRDRLSDPDKIFPGQVLRIP